MKILFEKTDRLHEIVAYLKKNMYIFDLEKTAAGTILTIDN